jgi:hypothetical protein
MMNDMRVDLYTAKTGGVTLTTGGDSNTIIAVDRINNKIQLATTASRDATTTATTYIFREDSRGYYAMGLLGLVDGADSTGAFKYVQTLQGIDRNTNAWWNSGILDNAGTGRDLSLTLLQQLCDIPDILIGKQPTALYSGYAQRQKYLVLLEAKKQFMNIKVYDGGWAGADFSNGGQPIPWFVDHMFPPNVVFAIHEPSIFQVEAGPLDWMVHEGGGIWRFDGTQDAYSANCFHYLNYVTDCASANAVLRDLN